MTEDDVVRGHKVDELMTESIERIQAIAPDLDDNEARILSVVLDALWPLFNQGQATSTHTDIRRIIGNHQSRRTEVRNNPIAEVKAYKPKEDPNW